MPPQIQALLQQRNVQIGIGVAVLLILVLVIFQVMGGGGNKGGIGSKPLTQLQLATVDSPGKAIEIQALLARQGLQVERKDADNKIAIEFAKGATEGDRDKALIALVQSGLMDKNVGLEAFDKGDLTASREEKKIKLVRAQQGELARLIRKIDPIEDASVSLSIPEQTLFRNNQQPMSAAVQIQLPSGTRIDRDKVRSIINLMTGSVQGLDSQHVALTDTNGNTYNSVLDAGSELGDRLEEQDNYMKQKVASQLDKLVGPNNYVVTVSTLLREATRETMTQTYDPDGSVVSSKQTFKENLNANSKQDAAGGAASSFIPNSISTSMNGGGSNKDYDRNGQEVTYENTKTQFVETQMPGMLEDISIAVTIDKAHYPDLNTRDLQMLIAHAASPKVRAGNVSVASVDFDRPTVISDSMGGGSGGNDSGRQTDWGWVPFAAGSVIFCIIIVILMSVFRGKGDTSSLQMQATQHEIQQLKEMSSQQQAQLQAAQRQTQMLLEAQQKQLEAPRQEVAAVSQAQTQQLKQTLSELKDVVQKNDMEDEDLNLQIKSWIESG